MPIATVLSVTCHVAIADDFIELTIPLRDGKTYSVRQFCQEANRKLGTHYALDSIPDQDRELSVVERAALLLGNEAGLIRARIESDRLVLALPNPEDDRTRRRNRQRLERMLGIQLDQWPKGKGLHLPDHFDPRVRSIVLVHGLESHTAELQRFAEACSHWGIQPVLFDYPNDGPLAWSGDRLSDELKALAVSNLNRNRRAGFSRRKLRWAFGSRGTRGGGC